MAYLQLSGLCAALSTKHSIEPPSMVFQATAVTQKLGGGNAARTQDRGTCCCAFKFLPAACEWHASCWH